MIIYIEYNKRIFCHFHTARTRPNTVSKSDDNFCLTSCSWTLVIVSDGKISIIVLQVSFLISVSCAINKYF